MTATSPITNVSPPAAATASTEYPSEMRVLLHGVSWETYERLLEEVEQGRNKLFAYCDGVLEIMVPLEGHERSTRIFEHFLGAIVDELGLEMLSLGSLTMKDAKKKMGLEPDCCFYIANESAVREVDRLDFEIHPPPDLAIEVDNSSISLNKFPIYVALKIPEIWRLRRGTLTIYRLNDVGLQYEECDCSLAFPQIPVQELPQFIERAQAIGQRATVREFIKRLQEMLAGTEGDRSS
ncbi:MAG: Uma2 family endonuclease [Coleofasciculaceae cyanobacterium SM2_3_26]|nr:Uma2 family endonuclease [Coleofasciculaceae cyanobacterium SM2_3_26]